MSRRAFSLRLFPVNERDPSAQLRAGFGVAVEQVASDGAEGEQGAGRPLVRVWGTPLRAVTDQLLEALKRCGYKATDLNPARRAPFALDEPLGVRLALLLLAVKPLRKHQRIEEVAAGIRSLSDEEAYYWFSKCADPRDGRRGQHALRVMLSPE
jgi:hypothetical protein